MHVKRDRSIIMIIPVATPVLSNYLKWVALCNLYESEIL